MVVPITLPMSGDKCPQRFFLLCTSAVSKNTIRDGGSTVHTIQTVYTASTDYTVFTVETAETVACMAL